jgi:hypothetical protein
MDDPPTVPEVPDHEPAGLTPPDEVGSARHQHAAKPRWSRRSLIAIAASIVVVAATAVTLPLVLGGGSTITARGALELDDFTGNCLTDPGFSDITQGTQVVVTNSANTVVGTSALNYAQQQSAEQSSLQPGLSVCIYTFTVSVPGGLSRYGIIISHRGTVWFSAAQMAKGPGLSLSSGGSGL